MAAELSDDWAEIFKLSGKPISIGDIAEVAAVYNGRPGSWPWCGVFRLGDGRGVFAFGQCKRFGWQDGSHVIVHIETSPHAAYFQHARGNAHVALYSQFSLWHAKWVAERVLRFMAGDRAGWADYRQDVHNCSSDILYALPEEVAFARSQDQKTRRCFVHYMHVGRYDNSWSSGLTAVAELTELATDDQRPICGRRLSEHVERVLRPQPSSAVVKCCESCGKEVPRVVDEQRNDFWRCNDCTLKLFGMLRDMTEETRKRETALAKLTPEEKQALGL